MTTTIAPDLKPDHTESEQWPTLGRDPTHATREELDAHSFDPTQGRKIGSDPTTIPPRDARSARTLRRPHPGTQARLRPYDDPTQGRKLGSDPTTTPPRDASSAPTLRRPHPGTEARLRPRRRPHRTDDDARPLGNRSPGRGTGARTGRARADALDPDERLLPAPRLGRVHDATHRAVAADSPSHRRIPLRAR